MIKALAISLLVTSAAFAELRQDTLTVIGKTNGATSVVISPLDGTGNFRGDLKRIIITVGGTSAKTNDLWITDSEGFSISTNTYVGGTTTTAWYTNNPIPVIGLIINGNGATSASVTNTIKIMYDRK